MAVEELNERILQDGIIPLSSKDDVSFDRSCVRSGPESLAGETSDIQKDAITMRRLSGEGGLKGKDQDINILQEIQDAVASIHATPVDKNICLIWLVNKYDLIFFCIIEIIAF